MARWFSIVVVVLWLAAMGSLVYRDVWPHWAAGDPPAQMPEPNSAQSERRYQSGVFMPQGRVGTSWVRFYEREDSDLIHTQTDLYGLPLLPPFLVDSELTYTQDNRLDTLKLQIIGAPMRLEFNGENYGMDFSCELITGPGPTDRYGFKLDAATAATMSDSLRPFTLLKDLRVGKTWRLRLINPLPALRGGRAQFDSYLVRVTGRETIEHAGHSVDCFRIESSNLRAWADQTGRVIVQEVDLPIFGTLTIRQEPYDESLRMSSVSRRRIQTESPAEVISQRPGNTSGKAQ
ncbi:MAG: hypothetical protein JXQ73_02105 [Phycisphaerae bacterium]|nr:hypothetical protein [Phycisphaerae bacterium]